MKKCGLPGFFGLVVIESDIPAQKIVCVIGAGKVDRLDEQTANLDIQRILSCL